MAHLIGEGRVPTLFGSTLSVCDVAAALSAASAGTWEVEQMVDPSGEVSIIVFPARDDPPSPTFMLYEKDGVTRVATIKQDVWESDQAFPSGDRAVASVIAAAAATRAVAA